MSSDRPRLSSVTALALLLAPLALVACGKKGPPEPRPRAIPRPANDLALRLRGTELVVTFSYPTSTLAGMPLAGLESVTLFEAVRVHAADAAKPDANDLEALGQPVAILEGTALGQAVFGARLRVRLPLPESAFVEPKQHIYAVRTKAAGGEVSPWSNVVAVVPRPAPEAPVLVSVEDVKEGVVLTWTPVEGATGYSILRRESVDPLWSEPIATVGSEIATYTDRTALYGTRYVYTVAARASEDPRQESAPRSAREVDFRDRFAPEPPAGLRAIGLASGVRLVWEASADADLAGYLVERSNAGLRFAALNETPIDALELSDPDAPRGRSLTYRVIAVDRAGNRSEPSATVDTRRP